MAVSRRRPEFATLAGLIGLSTAIAAPATHAQEASLLGRLDARTAVVAERAVQAALEHREASESTIWEVHGVARGAVTPLRTWQSTTGHWCRQFEQRVRLDSGESLLAMSIRCRADDGRWKSAKG